MTLRLLITARDAGAAFHLIEIARAAAAMPDIALTVVTQRPASRYFADAGIAQTILDLQPAHTPTDAAAKALLAEAQTLLDTLRPDAILCGLSTPGDGGIDEAMLAAFTGPSLVLQDFWGETNRFFGRAADLYLTLDEEGQRLTRSRHDLDAVVIGSPRHSAYAAFSIAKIRQDMRRQIGAGDDTAVIGFFGQALHRLGGYRRTLQTWAEAALNQPQPKLTVYRPHPRETESEAVWTSDLFADMGLTCVMLDRCDVEHALLACDVVCSAFSNCTYDVAYLNRFSAVPLATPVSLFFDPEIIDYFHRMVRLDEFPYLKAGLVLPARDAGALADLIATAAGAETRAHYWRAAQSLADPQRAPARALEQVRLAVRRASAATPTA